MLELPYIFFKGQRMNLTIILGLGLIVGTLLQNYLA